MITFIRQHETRGFLFLTRNDVTTTVNRLHYFPTRQNLLNCQPKVIICPSLPNLDHSVFGSRNDIRLRALYHRYVTDDIRVARRRVVICHGDTQRGRRFQICEVVNACQTRTGTQTVTINPVGRHRRRSGLLSFLDHFYAIHKSQT